MLKSQSSNDISLSTLLISALISFSASLAHASYSSVLDCTGVASGMAVRVHADPLVDYHNRNLKVIHGQASTIYNGELNNDIVDSLQSIVELERGIFVVTGQSSTDKWSVVQLYALPGSIELKRSADGMIASARFTAIMRGTDPNRQDRSMSRDFYDQAISDPWRAGDVSLSCKFGAQD